MDIFLRSLLLIPIVKIIVKIIPSRIKVFNIRSEKLITRAFNSPTVYRIKIVRALTNKTLTKTSFKKTDIFKLNRY